jgi:adenylate kinase family enzyme
LIAEDALSVFKKNYIIHNKYEGFNLVIDGLPRNISQFDALSNFMKNNDRDYLAILLESSDDTIKSRIQNVNRFRSDDNPETVQKKLKAYEDQTLPLIDILKKNNKLIIINSDQDEIGVIKSIKIELFKVF